MNYDEFSTKLEQTITEHDCTDNTGVFQCDQTGGFPTSLCVCWEKGVAWLMLNYNMAEEGQDLSTCEQGVADFGIRPCQDIEQFNNLLKELGDDAYDIGYMPSDEDEGMVTGL